MLETKAVSRADLTRHLSKDDLSWINETYGEDIYKNIRLEELNPQKIKKLYVYHNSVSESKTIPFRGIYKPLEISRKQYEYHYFTVEQVVNRVKTRTEKLFNDARLKWYSKMARHYRRRNIDLIKNPIIVRSVRKGHYEIIDGNRRLISKSVKEGFSFLCRAYIIE